MAMEYNIQSHNDCLRQQNLLRKLIESFLRTPIEKTSIHLTSDEAKWLEKTFPKITLGTVEEEKPDKMLLYIVTKNELVIPKKENKK